VALKWRAANAVKLRGVAVALCLALALIAPGSAAAKVRVFRVSNRNAVPLNIAAGPDGHLWFTEFAADAIVRMTPSGSMHSFALPGVTNPMGIVPGPLGRLWFTAAGAIGSITTTGVVQTVPVADRTAGSSGPNDLTVLGGQLYFLAGSQPWTVDRFDPATGALSVVAALPANTAGASITTYRSELWVLDGGGVIPGSKPRFIRASLLRISPAGTVKEYRLGAEDHPGQITSADGALWLANGRELVRVNPRTGALNRFGLPLARTPLPYYTFAFELAPDRHGNLWFTGGDAFLGERTPRGSFHYWRIPPAPNTGLTVAGGHVYSVDGSSIVAGP